MNSSSKQLASTPPMGWNSWNTFGNNINEKVIRETADALISSGLKDCGYEYIVIDDCWSIKDRRDGNGDLIPDPEKFPSGIKALADYVHSKGFKIGIYSDAAEKTCSGYPGSLGFEDQDAQLWASWGIDFLKYDYCHAPLFDQAIAIERYTRMGEALRNTGREFLFSLCEWGNQAPHLWARKVGGQMWRVSGDVYDSWVNIWMNGWYAIGVDISIDLAAELHEYGGPGGWNDLDMLVVGLKGKEQIAGTGMSFIEYQTHMSLWVMACSPLMIGCDVRKLDTDTASLLMNREVLDVNQDPLGIPARRVKQTGPCEIWKKPLADGSLAVSVINRGSRPEDVTVKARDIGLFDTLKLARNLWTRQDIADFKTELVQRVQPHETVLLKVSR
ncbi:MAG TPA: glycoside hydrolase family 27 protein [Anaerolineales bacterium]|nr:glycoside hydrolase family 27 protein [Anaerolineales bacterium]